MQDNDLEEKFLTLPWEALVTDGHVRAAQVRWLQPWLIAAAILAILVSFYLAAAVHKSTSESPAPSARVDNSTGDVSAAVAGLPALQVGEDEGNTLAPFRQIGQIVVPRLLRGLEQNDRLGTDVIKVTPLSVEDFWRQPWPHSKLVGTGTGDVRLVGAVANQGTVEYVSPTRWMGVFRKRNGHWQFLSAIEAGFSPAAGRPVALLEDIPLTLKPVLPAKD
jgi:hypothetical protein